MGLLKKIDKHRRKVMKSMTKSEGQVPMTIT